MRNFIFLCFALCLGFSTLGQSQQIDQLIEDAIKKHDAGDYEAAIKLYDDALKLEPKNTRALAEKGFSLYRAGDFKACVKTCESAIKTAPKNSRYIMSYVTLGNALDALQEPQQSLKVYNRGLKVAPDFYLLHFNKSITYFGLKEYAKSLESAELGSQYNRSHASSVNVMATLLNGENRRIPALLTTMYFLVLEPSGDRANGNFDLMKELLGANVEKKGNQINITIPSGDESSKRDDFSSVDLIFSLTIATIGTKKEDKDKNEVELFQDRISLLIASLTTNVDKKKGYYWESLAPYFVALENAGHLRAFCYWVNQPANKTYIADWLKENEQKVATFREWHEAYEW